MRAALPLFVCLLAASAVAQPGRTVRATTDDGRRIVVHANGTWEPDSVETIELDLSSPPPPPAPPPGGTRTLTSASGVYTLTYDTERWSRPRQRMNGESEYELTLPFGAAYALTIFEAFPATSKQVRDFVVANAETGTGGFVEIVRERPVTVDGVAGIRIEMEVTADNGLELYFVVTALGGEFGALQLSSFLATSNLERHYDTVVALHEGLRLTLGE